MQQRQPYPPGSAMSLGNAGAFSSSSSSSSAVAAATMADVATHRANGEPIPMSEQLMQVDQAITLTLQEIDANFARSHQTITGKILPAIRRYGIASHNTWQGARFWHRFFETASDINLVPTYEDGDGTAQDSSSASFTSHDQDGAANAASSSPSPYESRWRNHGSGEDISEVVGADDSGELDEREFEPPRLSDVSVAATARLRPGASKEDSAAGNGKGATWASVESPYENLKRHVDSNFSIGGQGAKEEKREQGARQASTTPAKAGPSRLATDVLRAQHDQQQRKSAQKVQATPRKGAANRGNPFTAKKAESVQRDRWNGIADLRKTPLAKVQGERRSGKETVGKGSAGDDSIDSLAWPPGMSPPVTMQFSVPRSKYSKTPAKEAAQLVVDGLLKTVEDASPATRQWMQQEREMQRGQAGRLPAMHAGPGGLVSTPLKRGIQKGRKSLPTPPTVTKRAGGNQSSRWGAQAADSPAGMSSARLLDEDEDGDDLLRGGDEGDEDNDDVDPDLGTGLSRLALSQTSASIDKLLQVNPDDEDSSGNEDESESDEEDDALRRPAASGAHPRSGGDYPTASSLSSVSRSIDQDTLFGIRDPSRAPVGPGPSALKTALAFSSSELPSSDVPSSSTGSHPYEPMGAHLYEQGTVYGGRPLLGDDREDTFSAPSPTPATAAGRRSK